MEKNNAVISQILAVLMLVTLIGYFLLDLNLLVISIIIGISALAIAYIFHIDKANPKENRKVSRFLLWVIAGAAIFYVIFRVLLHFAIR